MSKRGPAAPLGKITLPPELRAKKAKKPCAYGPRDEDGKCPKKPKAAKKTRAKKAKPPCKYGPRDEDGRCPKKPSPYSARGSGTGSQPTGTRAPSGRRSPVKKQPPSLSQRLQASIEKEAKATAKKEASKLYTKLKTKEGRQAATNLGKKLLPSVKKLGKVGASLGVVGALGGVAVATVKRAKIREQAYRMADAAVARQEAAQKAAGRPMSAAEKRRLTAAMRRAYITQLEK